MRKLIALLLVVIVGIAVAGLAMAGTADLSWVNPTTNTDGSGIPATGPDSLASTAVEWFQCAATTDPWPANPSRASIPAPATTYRITGLTGGQRYCARAFAVNVAGGTAASSNVVTKVIPPTTPNPVVLTVIEPTAYRMRQSVDGFEFLALGSVPIGTACDARDVTGYHLVPRANVTLTNRFDTLPLLVFARCG